MDAPEISVTLTASLGDSQVTRRAVLSPGDREEFNRLWVKITNDLSQEKIHRDQTRALDGLCPRVLEFLRRHAEGRESAVTEQRVFDEFGVVLTRKALHTLCQKGRAFSEYVKPHVYYWHDAGAVVLDFDFEGE